jgi:hypothetical protein
MTTNNTFFEQTLLPSLDFRHRPSESPCIFESNEKNAK